MIHTKNIPKYNNFKHPSRHTQACYQKWGANLNREDNCRISYGTAYVCEQLLTLWCVKAAYSQLAYWQTYLKVQN